MEYERIRKTIPPLKTGKLEPKDEDKFNHLVQVMTQCVKSLGGYNPAFDDPLIHTVARSIIYAEKIEKWIDKTDEVSVATSATDAIVKHRAIMRAAIEDLAANRKS